MRVYMNQSTLRQPQQDDGICSASEPTPTPSPPTPDIACAGAYPAVERAPPAATCEVKPIILSNLSSLRQLLQGGQSVQLRGVDAACARQMGRGPSEWRVGTKPEAGQITCHVCRAERRHTIPTIPHPSYSQLGPFRMTSTVITPTRGASPRSRVVGVGGGIPLANCKRKWGVLRRARGRS